MTRGDQHWWPVWIPLCGYRCGYLCGYRCGYICGDPATTSHNDERRRAAATATTTVGIPVRIEAGTDDTTTRRPALVVRAGGWDRAGTDDTTRCPLSRCLQLPSAHTRSSTLQPASLQCPSPHRSCSPRCSVLGPHSRCSRPPSRVSGIEVLGTRG